MKRPPPAFSAAPKPNPKPIHPTSHFFIGFISIRFLGNNAKAP